jgi:hypothetical protein
VQINNKNSEFETVWIYQGENDKKKSEKDVYTSARKLAIIDDEIRDELYKLYEDRNRVVHRFVISEITAAEIEHIAFRYYIMRLKINKLVYDIENKQIKLNLGMTKRGKVPEEDDHKRLIKEKMGGLEYFADKQKRTE